MENAEILESPDSPIEVYPYKWYLFNDFLVTPRPAFEIVQFKSLWKVSVMAAHLDKD